MKKNIPRATIGLLSAIFLATAQATSCDHANVNIENQSTQILTITKWIPLVYSQIKILNNAEAPLVLSPGSSMHFDVEQTSSLMQQSGGKIQLYNEKEGKQETIWLQFLFQEILLSCVPLDMTRPNSNSMRYQKMVISTRKQWTELTYVFY